MLYYYLSFSIYGDKEEIWTSIADAYTGVAIFGVR